MIRMDFNREWRCFDGSVSMLEMLQTASANAETIDLPHDAMIHEARTPDTANGGQTGFYPGKTYQYIKTFDAPAEWAGEKVCLEFEGVYQTAMVYVNDCLVAVSLNGYRPFYADLNRYLNYGSTNVVKVIADNACEKNSRWYSGSGIFRSVHLLIGKSVHILPRGIKIKACDISPKSAVVDFSASIANMTGTRKRAALRVSFLRNGSLILQDTVRFTVFGNTEDMIRQRYRMDHPDLWSPDDPALYGYKAEILDGDTTLDLESGSFGIRELALDAAEGLRINGKPYKLRGTCVHHDHGILGAAGFARAEERKCEILKQAGFNAIRSAHQPMSRAMLDACDRLGILVMDELTDVWTTHKNPHDDALHFESRWKKDIQAMVEQDYNHPCVIIYSIGNEIQDISNDRGRELNRMLANAVHSLDPSRYVSNGIHGLIAIAPKMDQIMADLIRETGWNPQQPAVPEDEEDGASSSGSNGLNSFTQLQLGNPGAYIAAHPLTSECVEDCIQPLDIAGYNYFSLRHVTEQKCHPNKPVMGTEAYPSQMVPNWKDIYAYPHILGDFTWIGLDYLGEAGAGIFYYDGKQNFGEHWPDRTAYCADINLIGYRRPISYLREMVFGLRKEPYIAVERVNRYGMPHSQNPWMMKDNIASWTWPGYEGKPAVIDVYSPDEEVELFLNDKSLGRKAAGWEHNFTAVYRTEYQPGELVAVSYSHGNETGRTRLETVSDPLRLMVQADRDTLRADGNDLSFLTIHLVDDKERDNLFAKKKVAVNVTGAGTLQALGNADPQSIGSYTDAAWETFDGYALAVIRSGRTPGEITVTVFAEGCSDQVLRLSVEPTD